ncbi:unnamed protein product [Urochloa humidicola]
MFDSQPPVATPNFKLATIILVGVWFVTCIWRAIATKRPAVNFRHKSEAGVFAAARLVARQSQVFHPLKSTRALSPPSRSSVTESPHPSAAPPIRRQVARAQGARPQQAARAGGGGAPLCGRVRRRGAAGSAAGVQQAAPQQAARREQQAAPQQAARRGAAPLARREQGSTPPHAQDLERISELGEGPSISWCLVMRGNQSLQLKKVQARQPPAAKEDGSKKIVLAVFLGLLPLFVEEKINCKYSCVSGHASLYD